jgi:hypothetical protein
MLREPPDSPADSGERQFAWQTSFVPSDGQAFELVFWKAGQDPLFNGIGLAAPTAGDHVTINLLVLDEQLGELVEPGDYYWGVLLVRLSPYERLHFFGASRTFTYVHPGDG